MADNSKQQNKNTNQAEKEIRTEEELNSTEDEVETEPEVVHLKTKTVPAIIILTACFITSLYTYLQHYPLKNALVAILAAFFVFAIIGGLVKELLDKIEIPVPIEEVPEDEETDDEALEDVSTLEEE